MNVNIPPHPPTPSYVVPGPGTSLYTYIYMWKSFKGDVHVNTSSSKMCSFGKIAAWQPQDGGPGLSILGYISMHTWTHAPTHIYIYTSFIQTCLSEGVTTALVLTWYGKENESICWSRWSGERALQGSECKAHPHKGPILNLRPY